MASAARIFLTMSLALLIVCNTNYNLVFAQVIQCSPSILLSDCSDYVQMGGQQITPSANCCDKVKRVGPGCLCSLLGGGLIVERIDIYKAVYVARFCDLTLQPGMNCGAIIVPPYP